MSPRLKVRAVATPLVLAGALWTAAPPLADAYGPHAQTPSPCSPDGVCLPKWDTFGVYQTKWRPFPGDVIGAAPTPADKGAAGVGDDEDIGGIETPDPSKEGEIGPRRPEDATTLPGEGSLLPELPGAAEPPGAAAPAAEGGAEQPQPLPPAEGGAGELPNSGVIPGTEPLPGTGNDPFGARRPAPPAWLRNPGAMQARVEPLPTVDRPAADHEPIEPKAGPVTDGPNLHGDDAPPALPASLQRLSQYGVSPAPAWKPGQLNALPPVVQPASISGAVDRRVTPVSGSAVGDEQVVPAVGGAEVEGDPEQALYIEATDQPPMPLPSL